MFPERRIYARIEISAEAIAAAVERDRALTSRMAAARLSPKHAGKAWRRIRGHRFAKLAIAELQGVIADLANIHVPLTDYFPPTP